MPKGVVLAAVRSAVPILAAVLFASAAAADDRRTDTTQLTIMSLNGEFLWDGIAPEEGQVSFEWKGAPTEARAHMQVVAEIITRADPDVVSLVEVENLDALTLLNTQFLTDRGYVPYLVKGKDTYTGQDVALLTRVDPEGGAIRYDGRAGQSGTESKSVSKNYVARLHLGNDRIALVGLHLLAQPNRQDRRLQREAQADAIRSIARDEFAAGYQVVVLGDFNDYDGAVDASDHASNVPITRVLAWIRGMDPGRTDDDLVNVASLVAKSNRYTAFWDQDDDAVIDLPHELTSIDHVLLAPSLASRVDHVDIPHDHNPVGHPDHFPVVVRLQLTTPATPAGGVRIVELLPNPSGDESQDETVTLANTGTTTQSLVGWKLRDKANTTWSLDAVGTLAAGATVVVRRDGKQMALNNGGDTIELVNAQGTVVQRVTYGRVDEDEVVVAGS